MKANDDRFVKMKIKSGVIGGGGTDVLSTKMQIILKAAKRVENHVLVNWLGEPQIMAVILCYL